MPKLCKAEVEWRMLIRWGARGSDCPCAAVPGRAQPGGVVQSKKSDNDVNRPCGLVLTHCVMSAGLPRFQRGTRLAFVTQTSKVVAMQQARWALVDIPVQLRDELDTRFAREAQDHARFFYPLAIGTFGLWIVWDVTLNPDVASKTLPWRLGWAALAAVFWSIPNTSFFLRFHQVINLVTILSAAVAVCRILSHLPQSFEVGTAGVILVVMYSSGSFRLRFVPSLVFSVLAFAIFEASMLSAGETEYVVATQSLHMACACVLGVVYNFMTENRIRRDFLLGHELELERGRSDALREAVQESRDERLAWLENLAGFLRHEMKNQIIGTRSSLELLQRRDGVPTQSLRYVERARRSIEVMQRLLEAATEATTLESAVSSDEFETFDFSEIVAERVLDFQAREGVPEFTFLGTDNLLVDGSPVRLVQLLDKVIGNAIEHSQFGSEISVSTFADESVARLVVENRGDPLPDDTSAIFAAFVSGKDRATSSDENLGIGLYVAKTIVEAHRGRIWADPVTEPEGARFSVTIPLARGMQSNDGFGPSTAV